MYRLLRITAGSCGFTGLARMPGFQHYDPEDGGLIITVGRNKMVEK